MMRYILCLVILCEMVYFHKSLAADEMIIPKTESAFSQQLPDQIQCIDIGFTYHGQGMPPVLNNGLSNNIIQNWNYCLAGYVQRASAHLPKDTFAMFFIESSTFQKYNISKVANPLPNEKTSFNVDLDISQFSHIQKTLGLFYCPYYLKTGDIFPLVDSIYYLENPFVVKRIRSNEFGNFNISRTPATLGIPLSSSHSEAASFGGFAYLPGLNIRVVRIYSKIDHNGQKEYIARICTTDTTNIISVAKGDQYDEIPGIPNIKKLTNKNYDPLMEKMDVQELREGEVIKGERVSYRITAIVPPDYDAWRVLDTPLFRGRVISWVELDPTPLDENGNPINNPTMDENQDSHIKHNTEHPAVWW